jgi:hypothetical protein
MREAHLRPPALEFVNSCSKEQEFASSDRNWNPEQGVYEWTPERPKGFHRDPQLEGYTLPNMLFLSKAVASNRTDLEPVFRWFRKGV